MTSVSKLVCLALLAGAVATVACNDSTAPGGPVAGRWKSDTLLSSFTVPLSVTLTQHDSVIEGDGMYGGTLPKQVEVLGFYSSAGGPTPVILTFSAVNTIPAVLFGRLSTNGDTLTGQYRWWFDAIPPDTLVFVRY